MYVYIVCSNTGWCFVYGDFSLYPKHPSGRRFFLHRLVLTSEVELAEHLTTFYKTDLSYKSGE